MNIQNKQNRQGKKTHVDEMKAGYARFFRKTLCKIALSPIEGTCLSMWDSMDEERRRNPQGGRDPIGAGSMMNGVCSLGVTCCLLPVLLPLTALTGTFSLILGAAAGITYPFAWAVTSAQDSCMPAEEATQRMRLR